MIARASNTFGFELWRRCAAGNFVMSPTSIATTLAMVWTGARGKTAKQMEKALHLDDDADTVARQWGELADELRRSRGITVAIANRLFGHSGYAFEAEFQQRLATAFGAPMETLDFVGAAPAARERINGWVAEQTQGKIQHLLSPSAITELTRLVLVNAVYFLGKWQAPFTTDRTSDQPFWISATESVPVPTMHQTAELRVGEIDRGHVIELPYALGGVAMYVAIPEQRDGLARLERDLDAKSFAKATQRLAEQRVALALPRFTCAPDTTRLNDLLVDLGIELAFDPARADFTGMAKRADRAQELVLSGVYHQAFVKTDEEGTVAAAATAATMALRGRPPSPRAFVVDRPFLFFIADVASGLILFMGRIVDPR